MPTPSVERLERVVLEDGRLALVHIFRQEAAGIVAGEAHRRLRQVVGAEREELRHLGNLIRKQARRAAARSSCPPDIQVLP
jgi:hypothetical protein